MTTLSNHKVSSDSLDWARQHIRRHGDTDIFPVPFEYDIIWEQWDHFRALLAKRNFALADLRPLITLPVPKTTFGFRVSQQLDPLDAMLYAAMVYEMGPRIESARLSADIACSYRFDPTSKGDFYPRDNGWGTYANRSRKLAHENSHVLYIDISDFYNQIYHHRVGGALETSGIPSPRAANVEKFLGRFTAKQSRGIPVGPSASHLLAESSLGDVDSFLDQSGVPFVRYVDDFRIFSNSTRELVHLLEELTRVLCGNLGLALQAGKTAIDDTAQFIANTLDDPGQQFNADLDDRLRGLAEHLSQETGYTNVSVEDIPDADASEELAQFLATSFEAVLKHTPVKLGSLKFLLREAKARRNPGLYQCVCGNLGSLMPIMGDVSRYLRSVGPRGDTTLVNRIFAAVSSSNYASSAYVALWVLDLLVHRPDLAPFTKAIAFANVHEHALGLRSQALLAQAHCQVHWVRSMKTGIANLKPLDRRALIWASSILPASERNAWLTMAEKLLPDPLDAAIAKSVRKKPP